MKRASDKSNLSIIKDYLSGERPFLQVGYDSNTELLNRKEGEEWEDSQGNKWKKENGIKKRISKIAQIKNDQKCLICNANIKFGNYLDQRIYSRCGKCYDCSVIFDSRLKILGKFNEYARHVVFSTRYSKLKDFKTKIIQSIEYLENYDPKLKYLNEDGSYEIWTDDTDKRLKVLDDLKKDLIQVEKEILEYEEELKKIEYDSSIEAEAIKMTLEFIKNRDNHNLNV